MFHMGLVAMLNEEGGGAGGMGFGGKEGGDGGVNNLSCPSRVLPYCSEVGPDNNRQD